MKDDQVFQAGLALAPSVSTSSPQHLSSRLSLASSKPLGMVDGKGADDGSDGSASPRPRRSEPDSVVWLSTLVPDAARLSVRSLSERAQAVQNGYHRHQANARVFDATGRPANMRPVVNQGLLPPPPGVTPDFRRRTDVQQAIVVVYGTTFALATVTLALRLYTAACIIGKIRLDTVIIVLAWLVSIVFFACTLRAMPSGFGRHLWDVTAAQVQDYLTRVLSIAIPYIWVPTLAKLAILVLYHRIDPAMLFPYCLPLIGASVVAYTVVCSAVLAGPCNPSHVGSGTCLNNVALAQAVLNIVTDAVLIVVPVPMVYRLHMPLRQKMTVAVLLAVGSA
ncbi:hypothetical protein VTK73DRAFT_2523 [Phialemonium thermophilum]|uniref:Rhodopsin domain-containing protein n=1 Tax=Phialemonium thermophilum TaxID=223376 RepID=A0ABR3VS27_9PEZI